MKFSLPYLALALGLIISVAAQTSSSNTYSNGTDTELLDEAIEVIHSGGDPMGDDSFVEPVRRSAKHKHGKKTSKAHYTSSTADKGAKVRPDICAHNVLFVIADHAVPVPVLAFLSATLHFSLYLSSL